MKKLAALAAVALLGLLVCVAPAFANPPGHQIQRVVVQRVVVDPCHDIQPLNFNSYSQQLRLNSYSQPLAFFRQRVVVPSPFLRFDFGGGHHGGNHHGGSHGGAAFRFN